MIASVNGIEMHPQSALASDSAPTAQTFVRALDSLLLSSPQGKETLDKLGLSAKDLDLLNPFLANAWDQWQTTRTSKQASAPSAGTSAPDVGRQEAHPPEFHQSKMTALSKRRAPPPIRGLLPLEATPGLISLLAGKPNAETFPIRHISFSARDPREPTKETTLHLSGVSLNKALQYGMTSGEPQLIEWVTELQSITHKRSIQPDWRVSMSSGSQDLINKAISALVEPYDPVLVEAPVYAGVLPLFQALQCELVEVEVDSDGIQSSSLREILTKWPANKPRPKVLYTVPFGCNPTGMSATLERRKEVLALARQFNITIMEDDPYYFLYFSDRPKAPSYFALEAQDGGKTGVVLRFDSLSKILSSGLRIGFATGPTTLLDVIDLHSASANLQVASTTQMIAYTLLSSPSWGFDGFVEHTKFVQSFYRNKRDVFERAMQRHLKGLAEWTVPEAGMFYWFKLLLPPSPGAPEGDSELLIQTKAFKNGVLALPGTTFFPAGRKSPFVRASFSLLDEGEVDLALSRLAEVVRAELQTSPQK